MTAPAAALSLIPNSTEISSGRSARPRSFEMIAEAADAVEMIVAQGIDTAMNKYNRRKEPPAEETQTDK